MLVQQEVKKIIDDIYNEIKVKYPNHKITKTLIHDICDYQFQIVKDTIETGERDIKDTFKKSIWLPFIGSFIFKDKAFDHIMKKKHGE